MTKYVSSALGHICIKGAKKHAQLKVNSVVHVMDITILLNVVQAKRITIQENMALIKINYLCSKCE